MLYDYKMKLLLWWRSDRLNEQGRAPINLRITLFGKRAEYETGLQLPRAYWPKGSREIVLPEKRLREADLPAAHVDELNSDLRELRHRAEKEYKRLRDNNKDYSAKIIHCFLRTGKSEMEAEPTPEREVLTVKALAILFYSHVEAMPEELRKSGNTLLNYRSRLKNVTVFLRDGLKQPDLPARDVSKPLCRKFERWCLSNGFGGASMRKQINMLQMIISHGVHEGLLAVDAIQGYKYQTTLVKKAPVSLPLQEVLLLQRTVFEHEATRRAVAGWLFCCATGLSWVDYRRFARTPAAFLHTDEEGQEWIRMVRQKMQRRKPWGFSVPFFAEAKAIYDAWRRRLPHTGGQNANDQLLLAEQALGLSRRLSTKLARATFSQLRRDEGYSGEVVASWMGDSVSVMDTHYSRISETRSKEEMRRLAAQPAPRLIPIDSIRGPRDESGPLQATGTDD